ncbi:MAG: ATP-binding protein [Lachnospiraceae bacterium]|nr:ATP-binding protein [Lachnospiraceae bacterium]
MGFTNEKLWEVLEEKVREEDAVVQKERQIGNEYLAAVKKICQYGVERAETIRDTFPMFTLHNETHICNVMQLMTYLLGDHLDQLTRDEAAMLIMSACCHDIGMSCSEEEKEELLGDADRLDKYLENNHSEYVKAYSSGNTAPVMTDDMIQNYLRSIHHERVMDLLFAKEWPDVLEGKADRENLISVCQSHGENISSLDEMETTTTVDLKFCAILLRLADILDFDTSRAPEAVYKYSGFQKADDANTLKSKEEWDKHLASRGFDFLHINNRVHMYPLDYSATCKSMQVEQTVNCYLDWVDQELNNCGKLLKRFAGRWQDFILPGKIKRNIKSEGYVSGQYRLSLDQDKILELLIGKDLYSDPAVFVRELIQNAIDAVRTREQLDKNLPSGWKGQINIRCWMDQEGYHWFRIEDNGTGMTEDVIMNYFLKIGSSYYSSDTFLKSKLQCNADADYMPISRFGIGILSCFMGDDQTNQVEVSTKHFKEGATFYPALRLSMHGINGYFYLSDKDKKHMPGPMKGVTEKEKSQYLTQAGTVIAVRTNLYQTGKYRGFKEIVDKYVVYPPVAIHYDGDEGSCDYLTEENFMDALDAINPSAHLNEKGLMEFAIPGEELNELYTQVPEISFKNPPKLLLKCTSLKDYTSVPFLKGAVLTAKVEGKHDPVRLKLGNTYGKAEVSVSLYVNKERDRLGIKIGLIFDDDFKGLMDIVDSNLRNRNHMKQILKQKISMQYSHDRSMKAVLEAVLENYADETAWKRHMQEAYGISEEKLNEETDKVRKLMEENGYSGINEGDVRTFKAFEKLQREWTFSICSLSELEWYDKYFKKTIKNTGLYSIAAHNGILCGDANFLFGDDRDGNLAAIILFKDKYRPQMDVARDGVRGLTLETDSEIAVIRQRLTRQGFVRNRILSRESGTGYSLLAMKNYCNLLCERSDLAKQLVFHTSEGYLSNDKLADQLLQTEKIGYVSCQRLASKSFWIEADSLYKHLCAAFLRENYMLQIKFASYNSEVFISKQTKKIPDAYMDLFPAFFFLPEINGDGDILTIEDSYWRYACNEYHRLSQFILKNGMKLKKLVPGIFRELLRVLAEKEGDELIDGVNGLLESLRKFPGGLFAVSDELFISEKDLV